MPREFEPTLIRTADSTQLTGVGITVEMDFNFGNLEGARILMTEYWSSGILLPATGALEYGLNFNATAPTPTVSGDIMRNINVFASGGQDAQLVAGGSDMQVPADVRDLERLNLQIVRNLGLQAFAVGGPTGVICKVYYRRLLFSESELGPVLAFRRG